VLASGGRTRLGPVRKSKQPFIIQEALLSPGCTRPVITTPLRCLRLSGSPPKLVIVSKSQLLPASVWPHPTPFRLIIVSRGRDAQVLGEEVGGWSACRTHTLTGPDGIGSGGGGAHLAQHTAPESLSAFGVLLQMPQVALQVRVRIRVTVGEVDSVSAVHKLISTRESVVVVAILPLDVVLCSHTHNPRGGELRTLPGLPPCPATLAPHAA
jgi:hypothetical protein